MANLFHVCIGHILEPFKSVGLEGTPMTSVTQCCHPIFTIFMGDYPEQVIATGVKTGECPESKYHRDKLEDEDDYTYRDLGAILDALVDFDDLDALAFVQACQDAGIKPIVHPFWEDLPYANIYHSFVPDILHQLYQGIIKHLLAWLRSTFSEAEIDAQSQWFPPNHNICLYMKGVTSLSQLSGTEHSQICRLVLGMVVDL